MKGATEVSFTVPSPPKGFNPRIHEECDLSINLCFCSMILIHAPTKDATISPLFMTGLRAILIHASARDATINTIKNTHIKHILIHASARDATAKSYKIGNNFTVLVRKFVQIFDILILHISIFLEKQEQYFYFCSANLPGFLHSH